MKTIKNSISMRAILTAVFAVTFAAFVNGQFQNPGLSNTQTPTQDVRTTASVDYSLVTTHTGGDEYRWEVTGGMITAIDGSAITPAATLDFTAEAHTITVDWTGAPAAVAADGTGLVEVQRIASTGCASRVQSLPVNIWSLPTASIDDADASICSGGTTAGSITVSLTGAPSSPADGTGLQVTYNIVGTDLTDLSGDPVDVTGGSESTDGSSLTIPLPASLINTTEDTKTLTVTLISMIDDFDDQPGAISDATYVLTVNPAPVTGDIATVSLSRR
jgi:hypothetical protein